MSDKIVEYGRHIFEDYYAKEKELRNDLLQNISDYGAGRHNLSVFLCFCENNKELTYSIVQLKMQVLAEECLNDATPSLSCEVMMFMNSLDNEAKSYDTFFKTDIFFPMIFKEWYNVWKPKWPEFKKHLYELHENFNFDNWTVVLNKLEKYPEF